jgi:hypothetical protein
MKPVVGRLIGLTGPCGMTSTQTFFPYPPSAVSTGRQQRLKAYVRDQHDHSPDGVKASMG